MTSSEDLRLSPHQREDIRAALRNKLAAGLGQPGQEIAALPAFFQPPDGRTSGQALVVDIGGTHVRAAWMQLHPDGSRIIAGPAAQRLPSREASSLDAEGFFDLQAQLVRSLEPPSHLPVGYCFSYPSEVLADRDARLLSWTKEIQVPDVVGTRVGEGLGRALKRLGITPGPISVLNDTVASLLGGALEDPTTAPRTIGLICGTGTNMAAFFDSAHAAKLAALGTGLMAVNLESGNFHPPHLTPSDDALDAQSVDPGRQRLEKAVSGHYLPQLLGIVCPDLGLGPDASSAAVVQVAATASPEGTLAQRLLERSSDLVAAALAAVIDHLAGEGPVRIQAEGGLFWNAPHYAQRVEQTLTTLVDTPVGIHRQENVNLFGAAFAALAPNPWSSSDPSAR